MCATFHEIRLVFVVWGKCVLHTIKCVSYACDNRVSHAYKNQRWGRYSETVV